jgi:hypothetical protein
MKIKVTSKNDVNIFKIEGPIKAGNEFELGEKIEEFIINLMQSKLKNL